jgi:AcrR family transcriptional regulator
MRTDLGRPRDKRIDESVLRATVDSLADTGYAELSVDAIARRAGTSKPAIYRRWPSKAHLVHEAVFPIGEATSIPDTGSLAADVREMVRRTAAILTTPASRAALPGLVAEMASDPTLHAALLERFRDVLFRGLSDCLDRASARGEVRPDVEPTDLIDALAGTTFMAMLTRPTAIGEAWVQRIADVIMKGIGT